MNTKNIINTSSLKQLFDKYSINKPICYVCMTSNKGPLHTIKHLGYHKTKYEEISIIGIRPGYAINKQFIDVLTHFWQELILALSNKNTKTLYFVFDADKLNFSFSDLRIAIAMTKIINELSKNIEVDIIIINANNYINKFLLFFPKYFVKQIRFLQLNQLDSFMNSSQLQYFLPL